VYKAPKFFSTVPCTIQLSPIVTPECRDKLRC